MHFAEERGRWLKTMRKGDWKLIQELNRSIILNKIRLDGPISRIELAKGNRISPSTVAAAVQELIREGYVTEIGRGESSGGRKPILLRFAPDNHFLFAASISNTVIEVAQLNLEANILRKKSAPVGTRQGEGVIELMLGMIDRFVTETGSLDACIGIAVTTPGVVNVEQGVVYYNSKLRLNDVPVKQLVESRYGIKTWVENDTNSLVLAERRFGSYSSFANLIYIMVGNGIGAGILVNDMILRGKLGGAGEFGHTSVNRSGIRCECGNVGCLENSVSWPAVHSRMMAAMASGRQTLIHDLTGGDFSRIEPAVYKEALSREDRLAMDITEEIAEHLGAGIVNLVNLFNPGAIVLGGNVAQDNPILLHKVEEHISRYAMRILKDDLVVGQSSLGDDGKLIGAAAVVLQDLFQFSLT